MKIKVEQKHIDAGERWSPLNCPVALAIKEVYPEVVLVLSDSVETKEHSFPMPEDVRAFVEDFDSDKPVSAFEFELSLNK